MGKKQMSIHLDEESVKVVRGFLEAQGQSFSSWVNAFVCEFAKEIKGQPSPLSKSIDDMTVKEFAEIASYWFRRARGEEFESQENGVS